MNLPDNLDIVLAMSGVQHATIKQHLFPGDGMEAAAIILCGRRSGNKRHRLVVQKIHLIPYEQCSERSPVAISWDTDLMVPWLEEADQKNLSVIKIHSHPTDYKDFSEQDDRSDKDLFPCIDGWVSADLPHASVIMLSDGSMFGRVVTPGGEFKRLKSVMVAGDDVYFWQPHDFGHEPLPFLPEFTKRHAQAFGDKTTQVLRSLSVAVIGCSGTGSPTIAQLAHLGVGRLVIVDPDKVHELNLNRIIYATKADADAKRYKVDVMADAVKRIGLGTDVDPYPKNLYTPDAVKAVAGCDIIIGCVDTAEGRFLLNLIASFYTIPFFDIGITLEASAAGDIEQVCGYLHYIQPGKSSLLSREAISMEDVRAEGTKRQNPAYYQEMRKAGYIQNVDEDRPAVISVNMQFSALAVTELIARLHPFRENPNRTYAKISMSLSELEYYKEAEPIKACSYTSKQLGRGDLTPLLDLPELSE